MIQRHAPPVFVPKSGYFARYLEIFRNQTASDITIDAANPSALTTTPTGKSSQNRQLRAEDRWSRLVVRPPRSPPTVTANTATLDLSSAFATAQPPR